MIIIREVWTPQPSVYLPLLQLLTEVGALLLLGFPAVWVTLSISSSFFLDNTFSPPFCFTPFSLCRFQSLFLAFRDSSVGKESTCNAGDPGSIPRLGRSAEQGIDNPPYYSWASRVAQLVKKIHLPGRRPGFDPWVGKIRWSERLPTLVSWPGEFQGMYSSWGHRVQQEWAQLSLSQTPLTTG